MENQKIAEIFQEIGDILEIRGENPFRVGSYHRAAQIINAYPYDLREIWEKDPKSLKKIPGIGESLAAKIVEILKTGKLKQHRELLKNFPHGLLEMLKLRGLGPKKTKMFYQKLGIDNLEKLKKAGQEGKLRQLEGMGEKSEREILKALLEYTRFHERTLLYEALHIAEDLISYLEKCPGVEKVESAGSLRRKMETIGDIDILATGKNHQKIIHYFVKNPEVNKIIAQGETKASVLLKSGVQSDLRVVDSESFGAALYYFTGSKNHNIHTRKIAQKMGLKINEYGVFKGKKKIAGRTENEVLKAIGLPYIIPEMREDWGEIEIAQSGRKLPKTVELEDLKGDLHVHSNWSDGSDPIHIIIEAARDFGLEYLAITDHSKAVRIANGLDEERLEAQIKAIDELNKKLKGFRILKGTEVDIKPDGSLDLPDSILSKLDLVVASIHSRFNLEREEQTKRIIKAFENPYVKIFGHPSARLLGQRMPIEMDMEAIMEAAKKYRVALEINCFPERLDLTDVNCKLAKERGIKIVISTDAHHPSQFEFLRFGIFTAKRGWLEKKDVLNTLSVEKLLEYWRKS